MTNFKHVYERKAICWGYCKLWVSIKMVAEKCLEEQNLVVNNARHILSQLLGGKKAPAQAQKYFITHMVMGDGVDPLNPSLPNPDSRF